MKVLALPIEMLSYTDNKGDINPIRFRLQLDKEPMQVIKTDKVLVKGVENFAGNNTILYTCQSLIDDATELFEIRYETATCKWILYEI